LLLLTAGSAHSKVIPSFDFAPEPGLLALALIEFISRPVTSDASSMVSKVFFSPFLNVAVTLVLVYFFILTIIFKFPNISISCFSLPIAAV
jgi:hypothetical protein